MHASTDHLDHSLNATAAVFVALRIQGLQEHMLNAILWRAYTQPRKLLQGEAHDPILS